LVVIAIIGVLVALLLPAVQAARESARRMQCQNHLKQMGLAFHNHHDTFNHLPTGGWGWNWVGDPDLGFGPGQPGGWTYNILPFIEQKNLREIGMGTAGPLKEAELVRLVSVPIKFYHCPSRRPAKLYPVPNKPTNAPAVGMGAKCDYGVNCGDQHANENGGNKPSSVPTGFSGILYNMSQVRMAQITDGTSNTLMIGEKYLSPRNYENGADAADNENLYVGFDNDIARSMNDYSTTGTATPIRFPPRQDTKLTIDIHVFGSAHSSGFNAALCDGSVRMISYSIDSAQYKRLGNIADGETIDWKF